MAGWYSFLRVGSRCTVTAFEFNVFDCTYVWPTDVPSSRFLSIAVLSCKTLLRPSRTPLHHLFEEFVSCFLLHGNNERAGRPREWVYGRCNSGKISIVGAKYNHLCRRDALVRRSTRVAPLRVYPRAGERVFVRVCVRTGDRAQVLGR